MCIIRTWRLSAFLIACASVKTLKQSSQIQTGIVKAGLHFNVAACGSLHDAYQIFNHSPITTLQCCNTLISGYPQEGLFCQALHSFERLQKGDLKRDSTTFISILKACSKAKARHVVKLVHAEIIKNKLESDIFVGTSLVDAYAKCGNIIAARKVFDSLPSKNLVSWNAMISGYAHYGSSSQALELFEKMQEAGISPDGISFVSALRACSNSGALDKGKLIHSLIIKSNLRMDLLIGNSLINMYMKCGSLVKACSVFNKLPKRDAVSWNALIGGHVLHGHGKEALELFKNMEGEGLEPDNVTYVIILKACGSIVATEEGRSIHNQILKRQLESNVFVSTALMNMYAKCGKLFEARQVFDKMTVRNRVSWNAIIAGYVDHKLDKEAIELFEKMKQNGIKPDKVTFQSILKACGRISLDQGRLIHREVVSMGLESNLHVGSTLVDMYANFKCLDEAQKVFNSLLIRDTVSWNALITGYAQQGSGLQVLQMFKRMQDEGIAPDSVTFVSVLKACGSTTDLENGKLVHNLVIKRGFEWDVYIGTALIDMYVKCGSLDDGKRAFDSLLERDLVAWNVMIAGFVHHGYSSKALELFKKMEEEGLKPDSFTFVSVLKACGCSAAIDKGKCIHAQIRESGLKLDSIVANNLVDMYAKCGRMDEAYEVFASLKRRDVTSWNTLIAGYAHLGLGVHALKTFDKMLNDGVQPNEATFVCVLSACSHANLLKDGVHVFESMADFGISPKWQHYTCMVDILSRAGNLLEAEEFILRMPVRPDVDIWMSLLGACRTHGNVELGRRSFESILKINKKHYAAHVLMSNIYAKAGRWEEKSALRKEMESLLEPI